MEKLVKQWLANPWVIKFLIAFLGLVVIRLLVGALRRSIPGYVKDSQASGATPGTKFSPGSWRKSTKPRDGWALPPPLSNW
jgi:hypothetical protein